MTEENRRTECGASGPSGPGYELASDFDRRLFGIDEMPRTDIERHARSVAEHVAKTLQA